MQKVWIAATLLAVSLTAGCGDSNKMADTPTDEQIKAVEQADKQVESEERGTPVKGKKAR